MAKLSNPNLPQFQPGMPWADAFSSARMMAIVNSITELYDCFRSLSQQVEHRTISVRPVKTGPPFAGLTGLARGRASEPPFQVRKGQALAEKFLGVAPGTNNATIVDLSTLPGWRLGRYVAQDKDGQAVYLVDGFPPCVVKPTSNLTGGGKYNGRIWLPPTAAPSLSGNMATSDAGTDPGYDNCYIFNAQEMGQTTHALTNVSNTVTLYEGHILQVSVTDGKPVVYVNAIPGKSCS